MYFTRLPDHTDPNFDEKRHFSQFKKHNIVFNAVSDKSCCERHIGCLSIKTVIRGDEWYGIDHNRVVVRPGQFLVLNDDQEYSSGVDSAKTRTVSVFFRKEFACSVFRDALRSEETLLDTPYKSEGNTLEFFQTLYNISSTLQQKLLALIASLDEWGYNGDMVDEQLVFLLHELIRTHKKEVHRAGRVSAVKPATRKEIYKRLCVAKDFLHSTFMDKPELSLISDTACLSTAQLVRQFKAAYQITPHQYLTRIRLDHAAGLLKHTRSPVNEITWACGFENTSAFCRAFKRQYGTQPVMFRKMSK